MYLSKINVWISKLLHGFLKIEILYFFAILQGNVLFSGKIYTAGKKIYTAAGRDGRDKFQVCVYC